MVSNVRVYGLHESLFASTYPMRSVPPDELYFILASNSTDERISGTQQSLGNAPMGSGHDNFLNGIVVQFDVNFTIKVWTEAERYHFLDFVSSMSTMHRLSSFDLELSYYKHVDERIIKVMKEMQEEYKAEKNEKKKSEMYLDLLYSNPVGMMLTARMTTNYRQLKTIYHQRRFHKLPEWREFCEWIETLPKFKELCIDKL